MAIRIDASGEILKRTANLPTTGAFTAMGWARFVSIRSGEYQYIVELANGTSYAGSYLVLGYRSGTTWEIATDVGVQSFASAPTTGEWFFWGLTSNGTTLAGYWGHARNALTTTTLSTQTFTSAQLSIGNDSWDEWCDIEMGPTYIYNAVLTGAEISAQRHSLWPSRVSGLNLWSPLWSQTNYIDYSPNRRNWTAAGTLTAANHAPVGWGINAYAAGFLDGGAAPGPTNVMQMLFT